MSEAVAPTHTSVGERDTANVKEDAIALNTGEGDAVSQTEATITQKKKRRKEMNLRSKVWQDFERQVDKNGEVKGICKHCGRVFCGGSKNGTSSMTAHLDRCKKYLNSHSSGAQQSQLSFKESEGTSTLGTWKFDQELIRKTIAYMIVIDELPFRFVENVGFRKLMNVSCPKFRMPSRSTATRDCYQMFFNERRNLKHYFQNSTQRISLTTDTWTSIQRINYMCVTAHFIDDCWKLHKKIISFVPIASHKGLAISKSIQQCLLQWGIEKVFTITVDNATANDKAPENLKKKFNNWGSASTLLNGKFLHMRCIAHIINLIVHDGLREMGESVDRVRAAVKYIRQSPLRLQKFKECVEIEKIESKSLLCLDVATRWNSTYLMLDAAQKFESAFERFEEQDSKFRDELEAENGPGVPNFQDWKDVRRLVAFLKHFYDLTVRVSGTSYVTSNILLHEIASVAMLLQQWVKSDEPKLVSIAEKMKEKYDKYWGDMKKVNMLIYVAVVVDPRYKMEYVEFALKHMYGKEVGEQYAKLVRDVTYDLYNEYKRLLSTPSGQQSSFEIKIEELEVTPLAMISQFKKYKFESGGGGEEKSDLDKYLVEDVVNDHSEFSILGWWELNCKRFSTLSCMARDVLAVPISTVASESTFSTGGRVLDAFRSSLTPKIVQALICTQDWLRGSTPMLDITEDFVALEKIEHDFVKLGIDTTNIIDCVDC